MFYSYHLYYPNVFTGRFNCFIWDETYCNTTCVAYMMCTAPPPSLFWIPSQMHFYVWGWACMEISTRSPCLSMPYHTLALPASLLPAAKGPPLQTWAHSCALFGCLLPPGVFRQGCLWDPPVQLHSYIHQHKHYTLCDDSGGHKKKEIRAIDLIWAMVDGRTNLNLCLRSWYQAAEDFICIFFYQVHAVSDDWELHQQV